MDRILERKEPEIYLEHSFVDSKFIEVVSNEWIEIQMQYPLMKMNNAEKSCFIREEVYDKLMKASMKLPEGYKFKILDAWRPFALQQELFDIYSADIIRKFSLENVEEKERRSFICKFISEPVKNRNVPPVHTTGGAVDVTILDSEGKELDMGTEFDVFSAKAYTDYYEESDNSVIKYNRRLLYNLMTGVGFTNLPSEWWHYDYGDCFWAFYKRSPAFYRGVFTKEEIYEGY